MCELHSKIMNPIIFSMKLGYLVSHKLVCELYYQFNFVYSNYKY
jgi:hypothetical protein